MESYSEPEQSYYHCGVQWNDLYQDDTTANFCLKALAVQEAPLNFNFEQSPLEYLQSGEITDILIQISNNADNFVSGTGELHFRNQGEEFATYALEEMGDDYFKASLPPAFCRTQAEYYFTAESQIFGTINYPDEAPDLFFTATAGEMITLWDDDFENDLGWTTVVYDATTGAWQRGIPVADPGWPYAPVSDADGDGQCYLTQNEMGETDVDNGAVRLISPVFEMDQYSNVVYDYYLYLSDADYETDRLIVEISSDGGSSWIEIANHYFDGGQDWHHHLITAEELAQAGINPAARLC